MSRRTAAFLIVVTVAWIVGVAGGTDELDLIWAVEVPGGEPEGDRLNAGFNPASVVKAATTLWALERLGPDHRFETRFAYRGEIDADAGVLHGDLIVVGGGDPDFHVENAYLVAGALNELGLSTVRGSVYVDQAFWIGWEGESNKGRETTAVRAAKMAARVRDALDPRRWNAATRRGIEEFQQRRGWIDAAPPRVLVTGEALFDPTVLPEHTLAVHRSNALSATLKRFNAYSNNDIGRLGHTLGSAETLAAWLAGRWEIPTGEIRLATLSGLKRNRMTPGLVLRLLDDLEATAARHELTPGDLLARAGCDPGTLNLYPRMKNGELSGAVVAKTGTLRTTDGGVSVLAGFLSTRGGQRRFCVAAPGSGRALSRARTQTEQWLVRLAARSGGVRSRPCGAPVVHSDHDASVVPVGRRDGGSESSG